ncbi:MAG TPA: 2-oxo-4-hydroxy-4-carboxy-5-ureidoimidazoline decarboxylase [Acidimicrobiia bacterium]|nr:2-oxo-4-hydroxy-4-carboxy-5-ureidoimidazoline decarboxylase [Acidimicrobiia bacterium]
MDLAALNRAERERATADLLACCGSRGWAESMADRRPFAGVEDLLQSAGDEWWVRDETDWLEAFAAHPRIGEHRGGDDRHSSWSRSEQSGMEAADTAVTAAIADCNRRYEERFGYRFLVCATGLGAAELLDACRRRLENDPDEELLVAAAEQEKITELRLRKLLGVD